MHRLGNGKLNVHECGFLHGTRTRRQRRRSNQAVSPASRRRGRRSVRTRSSRTYRHAHKSAPKTTGKKNGHPCARGSRWPRRGTP
jgi:hypothetical protein